MEKEDRFNLIDFIPLYIFVGKTQKEIKPIINQDEKYLLISYITEQFNNSKREHFLTIPKIISKNKETFESLGLLQAEMGKTQNGCIVFTNSEPKIINKVIRWFEKELEIPKEKWKWYIAVNIQEPTDKNYKGHIEKRIIKYWIDKIGIRLEQAYPKKVTYRKVKHTKLKEGYYGAFIIELKNNVFSQIIKNFLKVIVSNINNEKEKNIRPFINGIIAGEGTVAYHPSSRHYAIHISASNEDERELYKKCLNGLGITAKIYKDYKEILISERENLIQLLKQRLMTLHPRKYNKFLNMMQQYPGIKEETGYFKGLEKNVWNKVPQEKINSVLELYKSGVIRTKEIAEKLEMSQIKVQRVLKENNLGKRRTKTEEEKRGEIAKFAQENQKLTQKQIAQHFNVHESIVRRSCNKFDIKRSNQSKCKIPEEKIQKILAIYKQNPAVKFKEIEKEVGVSGSVIKRARRENNLMHLGYRHLIGCNNPNKKGNQRLSL